MRLALVRAILVAVDQHHVDARLRADRGDARAHEPGADDADLLDLNWRHTGRPPGALVEILHRDEQRADHRRGFRRAQDVCEVARLHRERAVERQQQAFVHDLHDGARRRIIVVGLAAIDRVRRRERHHAGLGVDRAARQAETSRHPTAPWPCGLALTHSFAVLMRSAAGTTASTSFIALARLSRSWSPLSRNCSASRRRNHARHALRAARAGEQADLHFRQPDARLVAVGSDTVMAGEAQLEAAAQRGAVDRSDPRLAARLQSPVKLRQLAALIEQLGNGRFFALRLRQARQRCGRDLQARLGRRRR